MAARTKKQVHIEDNLGDGFRDIFDAIARNDVELAQSVLHRTPAVLNAVPLIGCAPLHAAVMRGSLSMVRFFLDQPKIDVAVKDSKGRDALALSLILGHPTIKRELFAFRARELGLIGGPDSAPSLEH